MSCSRRHRINTESLMRSDADKKLKLRESNIFLVLKTQDGNSGCD